MCVFFAVVIILGTAEALPEMKENLRVAFVGDTDVNENAFRVLSMVRDENVDAVFHQGDLSYRFGRGDSDEKVINDFFDMLNEVFGPKFPYFALVGNHDVNWWNEYAMRFLARETEIKFLESGECKNYMNCCEGEYGINMVCNIYGLVVVFSGIGLLGDNWELYAHEKLSNAEQMWRICALHMVPLDLQIAADYQGLHHNHEMTFFEECANHGAIIVGAHSHTYSRSHIISNFTSLEFSAPDDVVSHENLIVSEGETFFIQSSTGGGSIREIDWELAQRPYWAHVGANTPDRELTNVKYGAVICTFNVDNVLEHAECYYKDLDGHVFDEFGVTRHPRDVPRHSPPEESAKVDEHVPLDPEDLEFPQFDRQNDRGESTPTSDETDLQSPFSVAPASRDSSCNDENFISGRISGERIESFSVESAEICCSECSGVNECAAWTFALYDSSQSDLGECVLRASNDLLQPNDNWISGVKSAVESTQPNIPDPVITETPNSGSIEEIESPPIETFDARNDEDVICCEAIHPIANINAMCGNFDKFGCEGISQCQWICSENLMNGSEETREIQNNNERNTQNIRT